jgi:hypothetical protein
VVAEAVESIYRAVLGAWIDSARVVSAASEEARVPDSMERGKTMRLMCYVPSVAILLEVVVLVEELAARAHCIVAAAVSTAQGVLSRRHLAGLLGSHRA